MRVGAQETREWDRSGTGGGRGEGREAGRNRGKLCNNA